MSFAADIFAAMPDEWRTDVVIHRGGGRDRFNNPLPEVSLDAHGCTVGWRGTADPLDFSELSADQATLYQEDEDGVEWLPSDRVMIPDGPWPSGTFVVAGRPKHWEAGGWEIALERDPSDADG